MADFATRLRELRKTKGLRQIDLANQFGVAQTTIANYEQHSRFPDEETLGKIATFFNVSLDFLLGRTDQNTPPDTLSAEGNGDLVLTPLAQEYLDLLLSGEKAKAYETINSAVENGESVRDIYVRIFEPTLKQVGRLWETGRIDVAMEHYFSAATETLMGQLYRFLDIPLERKGVVITSAIGGELHHIGIRMVSDALEEAGWDCYYLGVNTPVESIYRTVQERDADILALSATMALNVDSVSSMIELLRIRTADSGKQLFIITGGMAFNHDPDLWKRIGADGCARNAEEAVRLVEWLMRKRKAS